MMELYMNWFDKLNHYLSPGICVYLFQHINILRMLFNYLYRQNTLYNERGGWETAILMEGGRKYMFSPPLNRSLSL